MLDRIQDTLFADALERDKEKAGDFLLGSIPEPRPLCFLMPRMRVGKVAIFLRRREFSEEGKGDYFYRCCRGFGGSAGYGEKFLEDCPKMPRFDRAHQDGWWR